MHKNELKKEKQELLDNEDFALYISKEMNRLLDSEGY